MFLIYYFFSFPATSPLPFLARCLQEDAEKQLKGGKVAGNFLVREKGEDGKTFVHTYLSLTRMMIIHNLIEFQEDGSCDVDKVPWPHSDRPSLEDIIDKMQEIRRKRKGSVAADEADPAIAATLEKSWDQVSAHTLFFFLCRSTFSAHLLFFFLFFLLIVLPHNRASPADEPLRAICKRCTNQI